MNVNDANQPSSAATTSAGEPAPPPVAPAERPTIEPTDALPSEDHEEPSLLDEAKSLFRDERTDEELPSDPAAAADAPTPPPAAPTERAQDREDRRTADRVAPSGGKECAVVTDSNRRRQ